MNYQRFYHHQHASTRLVSRPSEYQRRVTERQVMKRLGWRTVHGLVGWYVPVRKGMR